MIYTDVATVSVLKYNTPESSIHQKLCKVFSTDVKYASPADEYRHFAGKLLVQQLLVRTGIELSRIENARQTDKGKWFLPDSNVGFNLSHSGDRIVCAVNTEGQIGIDIEQHRDINWQEFENILRPEEVAHLKRSTQPNNDFFDLWTKKESLLKAWGEGLNISPENIIIHERFAEVPGTAIRGEFHMIAINGYSCFLCTDGPAEEIFVTQISSL